MDYCSAVAMSRIGLFALVQEVLSSCHTFDDVAVSSLIESLVACQLPQIQPRKVEEVGEVDTFALKLLQDVTPNFHQHLLPVKVISGSNCIPRSQSILLFDGQNYHSEIRCRIVIELVSNSHDFLNLPRDELNFLCQFSDSLYSTPMETFQQETIKVSKNSVWECDN